MTNKRFSALLLPALLCFCPAALAQERPAVPARPNIVVILADDLGFGDVGINGATMIRTPHIDAIARRGVNFTQFYASANICTPSRAGLMTGRYPIRTGLAYEVLSAADTNGLPRAEETLAALAKRAGYATMLIGKWHLGRLPQYAPGHYGFDEFYGVPYSNDMPGFALYRGDAIIEQPVDQSTLTQRYTHEAGSFIARHAQHPFFLFIAHTAPHIPLYVSAGFAGRSAAGRYGDVVEELDDSVGAVMKALQEAGALANTIVFFSSDNGPFFEGSVAGLKGGKGSGWEGGFRVPLVVDWPAGGFASGAREAIAMNIDLLPTIAEILGLAPAAEIIDGKSLLANLRGREASPHAYLYYFNNEEVIGVRTQEWKYLTHVYYRRSLGAFEKFGQLDGFSSSYDMLYRAGPAGGEEYSYADRYPQVVSELKAEIAAARRRFDPLRTHPPDQTFPP
jgi:arylsulfatase A